MNALVKKEGGALALPEAELLQVLQSSLYPGASAPDAEADENERCAATVLVSSTRALPRRRRGGRDRGSREAPHVEGLAVCEAPGDSLLRRSHRQFALRSLRARDSSTSGASAPGAGRVAGIDIA